MVRYKIEELDFLFIYEHKVRELENLCLLCVPSIIPGS